MFEHRPGQHEAVDMGDRDARPDRPAGGTEAPAGHRAVQEEPVVEPGIAGGHHHGLFVDQDAEMADEPGVEDGIQVGSPMGSLLGEPPEAGQFGRRHLTSDRSHLIRALVRGRAGAEGSDRV